jgi:hypothetical protein
MKILSGNALSAQKYRNLGYSSSPCGNGAGGGV